MAVLIPVSWGELFDKITILQIKAERITDPAQNINIRKELAQLQKVLNETGPLSPELFNLMEALRQVNIQLWEIEDDIRNCERRKCFNEQFIFLARSVYYSNDKRSEIKNNINILLGSEIIEEKSNESYS
jgi:hypothetical protein